METKRSKNRLMAEYKVILERLIDKEGNFPQEVIDGLKDGTYKIDYQFGWETGLTGMAFEPKMIIKVIITKIKKL